MSKTKFPKSVSFNLKNGNDLAILEHVKRRNFSGYVKKLILEDMKQKGYTEKIEVKPLSKYERLQAELAARTKHS